MTGRSLSDPHRLFVAGAGVRVVAGELVFPCEPSRDKKGPSPYTFREGRLIFTCPVCWEAVDCGRTNITPTYHVAAARKTEHESRHTADFYAGGT